MGNTIKGFKEHTITLKQHTPLLSYLGDQYDSFLRVSQIKPAFNAFYSSKLTDALIKNFTDYLTPNIQHGERFYSFDIDIDIIFNDEDILQISLKDISLYFGNIGDTTHVALFNPKPTELVLQCWDDELIQFIIGHIDEFFFLHNFGNRTNKGFGSFYISDLTVVPETSMPIYEIELAIENIICTGSEKLGYYNGYFTKLFKQIEFETNIIRSVRDRENHYSAILDYFTSRKAEMTGNENAQHFKQSFSQLGFGTKGFAGYIEDQLGIKMTYDKTTKSVVVNEVHDDSLQVLNGKKINKIHSVYINKMTDVEYALIQHAKSDRKLIINYGVNNFELEIHNTYKQPRVFINQDNFNSTYLVRALLGLPESMSYYAQGFSIDFEPVQKDQKESHSGETNKDSLTRFASPIMYKIIYNKIYLIITPSIVNEILKKQISCSIKSNILKKNINGEQQIEERVNIDHDNNNVVVKIPNKFDIIEFLDQRFKRMST